MDIQTRRPTGASPSFWSPGSSRTRDWRSAPRLTSERLSLVTAGPRRLGSAGHVVQQVRRGPIALARGGFELLAIDDRDVAAVIRDQPGLLQGAGDDGHGRPACP